MNITKIIGSIKAKLFDGTGTALTSTLVSGKQSLDVNVTQAVTAKVQDGAGNALTSAARGSTQPLDVQVRDASGNQVTTFGADPVGLKDDGGTQTNPARDEALLVLGAILSSISTNGTSSKLPSIRVSEQEAITVANIEMVAGSDYRFMFDAQVSAACSLLSSKIF